MSASSRWLTIVALALAATAVSVIIASLLPKQTEKISNPLESLTDDELDRLDRWLAEQRVAMREQAVDVGDDDRLLKDNRTRARDHLFDGHRPIRTAQEL